MKNTVLILFLSFFVLVGCGHNTHDTKTIDDDMQEDTMIEKEMMEKDIMMDNIMEDEKSMEIISLENTSWVLESVMDGSELISIDKFSESTLNFDSEGMVTGVAICNSFFGSYTFENQILDIGAMGMTKKACIGSNFSEYKITNSLENIDSYKIENNKLMLTSSDLKYILTYSLKK